MNDYEKKCIALTKQLINNGDAPQIDLSVEGQDLVVIKFTWTELDMSIVFDLEATKWFAWQQALMNEHSKLAERSS